MSNMQKAEHSPKIVNGVLSWYEGNTFELQFELELVDQDDFPITIADTDTVDIVFRDKKRKIVKGFHFENISENIVVLNFDIEVTALFPEGKYTFDMDYTGENRVTILHDSPVRVE